MDDISAPSSNARTPLAPRNGAANASDLEASRVKFASNSKSGSGGGKSLSGSFFHPSNSSFSVLSGSSKMPSHILAEDLIMRGAKRKPVMGQGITGFYHSITHLHFGALGIVGDVEPLKLCVNLRVLYVYENRLTSLKGIVSLGRLTHLYAQDNRIASLDDFEAPPALEQLFLGGNHLTRIEGLDGCRALRELHVENQKEGPAEEPQRLETTVTDDAADEDSQGASKAGLPADTRPARLSIVPESLLAIAPTLHKLNVANCALDDDDVEPIVVLQNLLSLDVHANQLTSIGRLQQLIVRLPCLHTLRISANPVAATPKFRERVIVATVSLSELDGKVIKDSERAFLLSMARRQAESAGGRSRSQPSEDGRAGRARSSSAVAKVSNRGPQQLGVSIPSAQSYNLGRGHGLVGEIPAGYLQDRVQGVSAALPAGTRRPWARTPHDV